MRLVRLTFDNNDYDTWINPESISSVETSKDSLRIWMDSGQYYDIEDNIYSFSRRMQHEEAIESQ